MIQQLIIGVWFIQIIFFTISMENRLIDVKSAENLVCCQNNRGDIMYIEQWKIKESKFLHEKQLIQNNLKLDIPIYIGSIHKEELELFSKALDYKKDYSLLYRYVRLSFEERHMLLNVVRESKLDADELNKTLCGFYAGSYMKEIIELNKNVLSDVADLKLMLIQDDEETDKPSLSKSQYSYWFGWA
ncbi:MAG TPA: hypothetical protein VHX42_01780 [Candidatus Babeliales bacterium]|nr:hypothetical protein [Candidatus Babeliales bacterium]